MASIIWSPYMGLARFGPVWHAFPLVRLSGKEPGRESYAGNLGEECMQISYRQIRQQVNASPYTLAAPSWVWPGTVAENCEKLADLYPEVALLFLETESSLAYGRKDLPPELADLGLDYHLHLPIDMDWSAGAEKAFAAVDSLTNKVAFLSPKAYVLHPPAEISDPDKRRGLLADMAALWRDAGRDPGILLLENTRDAGPVELLSLQEEYGFGLCLDLGHIMAYEQALPDLPELKGRVTMLHLNAPGPRAEHRSLLELDEGGEALARSLIEAAGRNAVLTLEIFEPQGLFESTVWLAGKIEEWGL